MRGADGRELSEAKQSTEVDAVSLHITCPIFSATCPDTKNQGRCSARAPFSAERAPHPFRSVPPRRHYRSHRCRHPSCSSWHRSSECKHAPRFPLGTCASSHWWTLDVLHTLTPSRISHNGSHRVVSSLVLQLNRDCACCLSYCARF